MRTTVTIRSDTLRKMLEMDISIRFIGFTDIWQEKLCVNTERDLEQSLANQYVVPYYIKKGEMVNKTSDNNHQEYHIFDEGTDHESIILNNILPPRRDASRPPYTYNMIVNSIGKQLLYY